MKKNKKIILAGLLLSLYIVLSRFISLKTQIVVISFSFIPIIISAILLGPKYTLFIAAFGDFLGATLFPFGAYFVGFTILEGITGLIYGLFMYNKDLCFYEKKQFLIRIILSSIINLIIIGIFITGLMISTLYGQAYLLIITSRAITKIIMLFIQVILMYLLNPKIINYTKKYLID